MARRVWGFIFVLVVWAMSTELAEKRDFKNIPLPHQGAYTEKGASVGIGIGVLNPSSECDCLGIWQVQGSFLYTPHISGEVDVNYFGGDLDDDKMVIYQRYHGGVRFHIPFQNLDLYVGPTLGFENTDLKDFKNEWDNRNGNWWLPGEEKREEIFEKDCEKMFELGGFSGGIELGLGYRFARIWGITQSVSYEYNFSRMQQVTLAPGVAFNLREFLPWAKENLLASWISLEASARRFFNRGIEEWAISFFSGIQVSF